MDPTVPFAAARLLDFVRATEVGTEGPSGYNVIFGFNQNKLPKPLTQMTVDELISAQASFTSRFGSSASGAYQFMRATLTDLKRELGLRGTQVMDPNLQDRLAFHLLKRRGYEAFMAGQINRIEFGKRLAQEWASFPVLAPVKGAHRQLARGQSYYTGDPLNKALVSPEEFERVIEEAKALGDVVPPPVPIPAQRPEEPVVAEPVAPAPIGHNSGPPLEPAKGFDVRVYSKLIGAVLGAVLPFAIARGWLPEAANDPELVAALVAIGAALGTWIAPKNAERAS